MNRLERLRTKDYNRLSTTERLMLNSDRYNRSFFKIISAYLTHMPPVGTMEDWRRLIRDTDIYAWLDFP